MDAQVFNALSDFVLVGTGQGRLETDGSIDTTYIAPHNEKQHSRPERLEKGVQYVFHRKAPVENESLALRDLPERLSKMGFKIIWAPKSTSDMLHLYYGGPIFHIKFSARDQEFLIFNQVHMMDIEGWTDHDYVLVRTH